MTKLKKKEKTVKTSQKVQSKEYGDCAEETTISALYKKLSLTTRQLRAKIRYLKRKIRKSNSPFLIINDRWWYHGCGAEGLRWYNMGQKDEQICNEFGYESGYTAEEAVKKNILEVSENGRPFISSQNL